MMRYTDMPQYRLDTGETIGAYGIFMYARDGTWKVTRHDDGTITVYDNRTETFHRLTPIEE